MRWIITGGAGFIGKNVAIKLLLEGQTVVIVDKKSFEESGYEEILRITQASGERLIYRKRDLTRVVDLDFSEWFSKERGDVVVHLAAVSGVKDCSESPMAAFAINLETTFILLDAAADFEARRFVFASSGAVLAGRGSKPTFEESMLFPVNVYGSMKAAAEQLCRGFYHERKLNTVCLRFSNVYGPYSENKGSAANKFIRSAVGGIPLVIHGDGSQKRDFVFVADVAEAIMASGTMKTTGSHSFHISSGTSTAILHDDHGESLYAHMCRAMGVESIPFSLLDIDPGVMDSCLSSAMSRRALKIGDPTPLDLGLKTTVRWYRNLYKNK